MSRTFIISLSVLILSASLAHAAATSDFEAAQTITSVEKHEGIYLGRCTDNEGNTTTDALFVGPLKDYKERQQELAFPASLTSRKVEILNDIYNPHIWDTVRDEFQRETDRNGNSFMYKFGRDRTSRDFAIRAVYEAGVDPCTRDLPPGNPDRIACNPPEALADSGFGLEVMKDLNVVYRETADGDLVSRTSYTQGSTNVVVNCSWKVRIGR